MLSDPLRFMVRGEVSFLVMTLFEFFNSMETEGMTVAVTAAVVLICAQILCGIDPKAMMKELAMILIVLIGHKNARTMPLH